MSDWAWATEATLVVLAKLLQLQIVLYSNSYTKPHVLYPDCAGDPVNLYFRSGHCEPLVDLGDSDVPAGIETGGAELG
jgi:hypothetical protein